MEDRRGPEEPVVVPDPPSGADAVFAGSASTAARSASTRSGSQPYSRGEVAVVIGLAVFAGAVAAVFSSAAPTGTAWIDSLERAVGVGLVVLAGSRSRRWALVVGSALVSIGSPWPLVLLGLACLGTTVFLVETRVRSRMLGAAVGAGVALGSLGLDVPGPAGLETVLGLGATVPILWSGYSHSRRHVRRTVRRIAAVVIAVTVAACVLSALAGLLGASDVATGVDRTEAAVDAAGRGTGDESAALFSEAGEAFRSAESTVGSPWASAGRFVPIVGANLAAVQNAVGAGAELAEAGEVLVSGAEFSEVQLEGGGVDLVALRAFEPRMIEAASAVESAESALGTSSSVWLLVPLADRLESVEARLAETATDVGNALVAVEGLPSMLGGEGPRRYLFLFANPAEARDMGGHIGNWAEVVADDGQVDLVQVGGPQDLSQPERSAELGEDLPASLASMDPARFPQNLGATADLSVAAPVAAELFEGAYGSPVDGVVYADVEAFAALLELAGPVEVPGLDGFELDSANAADFLTRDQYVVFADEESAGEAIESVIEVVFERLTTSRLPGPERLGELFSPLVSEGHFQVYSLQGADRDLLGHFGLEGTVPQPEGHDVLGVFNRNAGPSKIDSFLSRTVDVVVDWDAARGGVSSEVTVGLDNDAPVGGVNELIGGSRSVSEPGTNVTDLVLITPFRVDSASVDGVVTATNSVLEGDLWRHSVRLGVPPGEGIDVVFRLSGTVEPGPDYELDWVGQPLLAGGEATVALQPLEGQITGVAVSGAASRGSEVVLRQSADATVSWRLG